MGGAPVTAVALQDALTFDDQATVCDAIAGDWTREDHRAAIRQAVLDAAAANGGRVHIAAVRRHLPAWVAPSMTGACINRLARRGYLAASGQYRPNGDAKARNATKRSPVWRLVRPIPPEALR